MRRKRGPPPCGPLFLLRRGQALRQRKTHGEGNARPFKVTRPRPARICAPIGSIPCPRNASPQDRLFWDEGFLGQPHRKRRIHAASMQSRRQILLSARLARRELLHPCGPRPCRQRFARCRHQRAASVATWRSGDALLVLRPQLVDGSHGQLERPRQRKARCTARRCHEALRRHGADDRIQSRRRNRIVQLHNGIENDVLNIIQTFRITKTAAPPHNFP